MAELVFCKTGVLRYSLSVTATAVALLGAAPAWAAAVPSTVQPGAVERSIQMQPLRPPQQPSVSIPAPEKLSAPADASQIRFDVSEIDVDGATALSPEQLSSAYDGLLNRRITLADLYDAANAITALYARHGYALSFAVVPAQQIENGKARITVIEGFISKIALENKSMRVPQVLADYAHELLQSRPLRTADLERYLLLANDIPGYTVHAVFENFESRFAERGATELVLKIERRVLSASATVDNRGSKAIGPLRADLQLQFRDLMGFGEEIHARGLWAYQKNEMAYGSLGASIPISGEGARLSSWVSYSSTRPSVILLGPGSFTGKSLMAYAGMDFSLQRSRFDNVSLSVGFTAKKLDGDIFGVPNSRDNIYVIDATGTYSERDDSGATQVALSLNQGLPIFGATQQGNPFASRSTGSAVYTAVNLSFVRDQELWGPFDYLFSANGQFASRPLLASEECGYGGGQFGRAFDDSEITGDACLVESFELRFTPTSDWSEPHWGFSQIQLYGFFDGGIVWKKGTLLPGEFRKERGLSTGGGIRLGLTTDTQLSAEYAKPLDRDVSLLNSRAGRVFISLSQTIQ
jgi:hemolysin activation/secretion protein